MVIVSKVSNNLLESQQTYPARSNSPARKRRRHTEQLTKPESSSERSIGSIYSDAEAFDDGLRYKPQQYIKFLSPSTAANGDNANAVVRRTLLSKRNKRKTFTPVSMQSLRAMRGELKKEIQDLDSPQRDKRLEKQKDDEAEETDNNTQEEEEYTDTNTQEEEAEKEDFDKETKKETRRTAPIRIDDSSSSESSDSVVDLTFDDEEQQEVSDMVDKRIAQEKSKKVNEVAINLVDDSDGDEKKEIQNFLASVVKSNNTVSSDSNNNLNSDVNGRSVTMSGSTKAGSSSTTPSAMTNIPILAAKFKRILEERTGLGLSYASHSADGGYVINYNQGSVQCEKCNQSKTVCFTVATKKYRSLCFNEKCSLSHPSQQLNVPFTSLYV